MHLIKDENGNLIHHGHEHTHEHVHADGVEHSHNHSHENGEGHEHEHHHHDDHDDDDDHDEHVHHHHDHDEHEHHHHHHADEVFDSVGFETSKRFTKEQIEDALKALDDSDKYGMILRSKGIVAGEDGTWIHFDFVPEESEVRTGASDVTGKIVVIGSKVNKAAIKELFGI